MYYVGLLFPPFVHCLVNSNCLAVVHVDPSVSVSPSQLFVHRCHICTCIVGLRVQASGVTLNVVAFMHSCCSSCQQSYRVCALNSSADGVFCVTPKRATLLPAFRPRSHTWVVDNARRAITQWNLYTWEKYVTHMVGLCLQVSGVASNSMLRLASMMVWWMDIGISKVQHNAVRVWRDVRYHLSGDGALFKGAFYNWNRLPRGPLNKGCPDIGCFTSKFVTTFTYCSCSILTLISHFA